MTKYQTITGVGADPNNAQSADVDNQAMIQDEFIGSVENLSASAPPSSFSVVPYGTVYGRRRAGGGGNSLPLISLQPRQTHVFRYKRTNDAANSFTIDVGDVARALVSAASANSYRYIMRTFRVRHVTVRASALSVGATANCSLQYLGQNTNEITYRDNTIKIDENAMVSRSPPRFSLASFWHDVETDNLNTPLFEITSFGGGELFVDMKLEYLTDVDRYVPFTLSGGTALDPGGLYKGHLATDLEAEGGQRLN